jgi:hypothetical protein
MTRKVRTTILVKEGEGKLLRHEETREDDFILKLEEVVQASLITSPYIKSNGA